MLTGWLRAIPLVAGVTAAGLMAVVGSAAVGCTRISDGTAAVDATAAPQYRTSVSVSRSEASVTSSQREARRQSSLMVEAAHTACEALSTSSAEAVNNLNGYVDAARSGGDLAATIGPARDSLNTSADQVSGKVTDTLPQDLHDALDAWVAAARATATLLDGQPAPEDFNASVDQVNAARSTALDLCDATY